MEPKRDKLHVRVYQIKALRVELRNILVPPSHASLGNGSRTMPWYHIPGLKPREESPQEEASASYDAPLILSDSQLTIRELTLDILIFPRSSLELIVGERTLDLVTR
jgi:hypothetical protein